MKIIYLFIHLQYYHMDEKLSTKCIIWIEIW